MIKLVTRQSSVERSISTLDECLEYFKYHSEIQLDTETEGEFNHTNSILTIQLGDYDSQWVIDFPSLTREDRIKLDSILFDVNRTKILHNAKYDIKYLWRHGFRIRNVYDTMLAECLLNAGIKQVKGFYSLYSLGKRYLGVELEKEVRGQIKKLGLVDRVINYAAMDVKYLSKIKEIQMKRLIELRLAKEDHQDIYTTLGLENNAVLTFAAIEYNGIKLDPEKWKGIEAKINEEVVKVRKELDSIVCETPQLSKYCITYQDLFTPAHETTTINWNSPSQKLEVLKVFDRRIDSTDQAVLQKVKRTIPIAGKMLEYSKIQKMKTAFGDKMREHINPKTGRIHSDFWQVLDTGRVSMREPK